MEEEEEQEEAEQQPTTIKLHNFSQTLLVKLTVLAAPWCPDLVLRVLCEATQLAELQLDAGDLGQRAVRRPARRVGRALADVDVGEGDLGWRLEGGHQPGAQVCLQEERESGRHHSFLSEGGREGLTALSRKSWSPDRW